MAQEIYQNFLKVKKILEEKFSFFAPLVLIFFVFAFWFLIKTLQGPAWGFYFLPVGEGDSELIITKEGVKILIDGGPVNGNLVDLLDQILPPFDKYIDIAILTHPQLDHFGGFLKLLEYYRLGILIGDGLDNPTISYQNLKKLITQNNVKLLTFKSGNYIRIGNSWLNCIYPPEGINVKDLNDAALVLEAEVENTTAIFTSDISSQVEDKIIPNLTSFNILKVAHHGSVYSFNANFFKKISPLLSIIEVGKNSYGHPSLKVIDFLKSINSAVIRTDQDGLLRVYENQNNLVVKKYE